jgi:hypothetical protein
MNFGDLLIRVVRRGGGEEDLEMGVSGGCESVN